MCVFVLLAGGRRVLVPSVVGHSTTVGQVHSSTGGQVGSGGQDEEGESVTFEDCALA